MLYLFISFFTYSSWQLVDLLIASICWRVVLLQVDSDLIGKSDLTGVNPFCHLGCVFRKCVLPDGLAKELRGMTKILKRFDLSDCAMVLTISTCKLDANNTPDALKHIPDLF